MSACVHEGTARRGGGQVFIQGWSTRLGLPRWLSGKEPTCRCRRLRLDPLEEDMATHSSILAWEIPWTEKPGRLQSMGLQRVGHD